MIQDYFAPYLKEGYRFDVEDAALSRDGKVLYLTCSANFLLPWKDMEAVKESIRGDIPGVAQVAIKLSFTDPVMTPAELICNSLTHMQHRLGNNPWVKAMETDGFELDDDSLVIYVIGERAADMLNETAAEKFARVFKHDFGYDLDVRFAVKDDWEPSDDIPELDLPDPVPEAPAEPKKNEPFPDGVIHGKKITEAPVPMDQKPLMGRDVVLAGRVFYLDARQIRNKGKSRRKGDSYLITFYLSDRTDSVCCKYFADEAEYNKIIETGILGFAKKDLKEKKSGADIILKGKVEYDQFINAETINVRDINLYKPVFALREDTWPEKRIELHAHTKFSQMDGLNDIGPLVKRAIEWGHPAMAITDHGNVQALPGAYNTAGDKMKILLGMEGYLYPDEGYVEADGAIDHTKGRTYHIVILAKNKTGLKNLYKLVSYSHVDYFYKTPRIPRSVLDAHREGLILGSACQAGELFRALVAGASDEELCRIASYYDYLEIQPRSNNWFMLNDARFPDVTTEEDLLDHNRKILEIGKRIGKPVVATGDTHYLDPEDNIAREIIRAGLGYDDVGKNAGLYFHTTDEMMEEFSYLSEEDRYAVVIGNTAKIADEIEAMAPTPGREFPRPVIDGADETLRNSCYTFAKERYGDPIPEVILQRLDKELNSIIDNHYATLYVAAKMLVEKSNDDGYVVGSRGSVGSSVVAFLSGISEVNPLAAHYICPHCKKLIWGDREKYECGVDMPPMDCPDCGTPMERDGYTIPFETFLGFTGNKEPDIDLNFAGEYQATAQKFVDEIFGAENTFKAGTVSTVAERTAFGFLRAYEEKTGQKPGRFEQERLTFRAEGVKRTTGQHAGGIIVVPEGHEIYEVTPIQYPANNADAGFVTTHFEYHDFEEALLKLDILGHDGPTMVRLLKESSDIDPVNVPYYDPYALSIFNRLDALEIKDPDYKFTDGTFGVPEFGTPVARGMLNDTHPSMIGELVRLTGLAHGTDVWSGNAQDLIRSHIASMNEVIATRDDIMTYLIDKGLPAPDSFDIMEKVRKGKGVPDDKQALMREHGVPEWYIDSCKKIQYMFPRGHAAAYVIMSCRIAYFKVYYPEHFYAARFTSKVEDFNWDAVKLGQQAVWDRMMSIDKEIAEAERGKNTTKLQNERTVLELAYEMYARGYEFEKPSLESSAPDRFLVKDGRVVVPFNALNGVGTSAATSLFDAYRERPFQTVEDMQTRGRANKGVLDVLRAEGILDGMAESDQISMF